MSFSVINTAYSVSSTCSSSDPDIEFYQLAPVAMFSSCRSLARTCTFVHEAKMTSRLSVYLEPSGVTGQSSEYATEC